MHRHAAQLVRVRLVLLVCLTLKFLKQIDSQTPTDKTLHLFCDNYATHKHAEVQAWLDEHKRFNMHFTPTSASRWRGFFAISAKSDYVVVCSRVCRGWSRP